MDFNMNKCNICPNECNVDRRNNKTFCNANDKIKIALCSVHNFEEPCISGAKGSGTIFFSNCNLKCVYCQNYKISQEGFGREISIDELACLMIKTQDKGVHNINLVTPTMYAPLIKEAIIIARSKGLNIPIIYNTSCFDSLEVIKTLRGYIDIYLPDFKYGSDELGFKYSKIKNYYSNIKSILNEMYDQVNNPVFENGIIQKGLIIRHMILPNNTVNSRKVLKEIKELLGNQVYISIMAQYFPTNKANEYLELNRKINKKELNIVMKYMNELEFENGYIQKIGVHEEEYVPVFDLSE